MTKLSRSAEMAIDDLREAGIGISNLPPDVKLFLYGVKPALATSVSSMAINMLIHNFPSLVEPSNGSAHAVIFQDAYNLYDYIQGAEVYEVDNGWWKGGCFRVSCKDFGIALGYPPSACAWFARCVNRVNKNEEGKRQVYYHGMQFMTHENLIVENINWLRENMPIPEHLQDKEYVSFPRKQMDDPIKIIGTFDDILSSSLEGKKANDN